MAILSREQLCSTFVNGAIPSQKDFCDLIESVLNRRDDHFFGFWQQGMKYCQGDVVIHDKAIYMLNIPEDSDEDCLPEGGGMEDNEDNQGNGKPAEGCICSVTPPDVDKRWCLLELTVDDGDWVPREVDGEIVTVYNLKAKIGIGTDNPQTRLEVTDRQYGSVQVEPNDATHPSVKLLQLEPGDETEPASVTREVSYQLADSAKWITDSLGYAFVRQIKETDDEVSIAKTAKGAKPAPPKPDAAPPVLLFITSEGKQRAKVGIGTEEAQGLVHAHQPGRGDMVVNPGNHNEPSIVIMNTEAGGNGHYLMSGVAQQFAYFQTDASDGFRFRKGASLSDVLKDPKQEETESLMVIKGNGDVGIGTEEPESKLEVKEEGSGTIRLDLSNDNPAVSTINLRPVEDFPVTYHAFGVDDDAGTFITNAPKGFVFKKGGEYGKYDNEVNINQGDKLVYISQDGKLGVLTNDTPESFELEVEGRAKFLTSHLETDGSNIERTGDLLPPDPMKPLEGGVLEKLEKLQPIKFKWKGHTNASKLGEQIGFPAQMMYEVLPELVIKSGGKKSVAYGNLTAVLVQAIKDQQVLIKQLEQRLCDLEEQFGTGD
ncbi:MAG: tail fiber domain-containing protein [Phaeodactylibacter sp.]|nr:tail fiber domain-containing protein [Phaeodactylibacter sp.]